MRTEPRMGTKIDPKKGIIPGRSVRANPRRGVRKVPWLHFHIGPRATMYVSF